MSQIPEAAVQAQTEEPDFVQGLQGYASFCETLSRGQPEPDEMLMLAAKFRDAAVVITLLQNLRDELRAALSAAAPLIAPPDAAVEAAVLAEREACAAIADASNRAHMFAAGYAKDQNGRWIGSAHRTDVEEHNRHATMSNEALALAAAIRARSASPKPGSGE